MTRLAALLFRRRDRRPAGRSPDAGFDGGLLARLRGAGW